MNKKSKKKRLDFGVGTMGWEVLFWFDMRKSKIVGVYGDMIHTYVWCVPWGLEPWVRVQKGRVFGWWPLRGNVLSAGREREREHVAAGLKKKYQNGLPRVIKKSLFLGSAAIILLSPLSMCRLIRHSLFK